MVVQKRHLANAASYSPTQVATFFSAVTATTIQFTYDKNVTSIERAVNLLWVGSLVFSLASAINSQLAYHWRSAIYRSPRSCVPWWVSIWITGTPLAFLVASVLAYSAGLVCFTFSVFSGTFIPIVITVCTSMTSVGTRLCFSRHQVESCIDSGFSRSLPCSLWGYGLRESVMPILTPKARNGSPNFSTIKYKTQRTSLGGHGSCARWPACHSSTWSHGSVTTFAAQGQVCAV